MKKPIASIAFAVVGIFVYTGFVSAQMSSSSFLIRWDTVNTGGSDSGSSSTYQLRDTLEAAIAGRSSSTSYNLDQGYRGGVFDEVISFEVLAQDLSDSRVLSSLSGLTATVNSVSGISVGNYVVVIQDRGINQVSAIGKVSSIGSSTVVLDALANAGTAPAVDGTNDYLYLLNQTSIPFGSLSSSSVKMAVVGFNVSVDSSQGYVIQVNDDGNLRTSTTDIDDVTDGSVTEASEEYGARSSDTTLANSTFDTADSAVTTTRQDIVTTSSVSMNSRNFLTFKLAISSTTAAGSYGNVISFIASGNF